MTTPCGESWKLLAVADLHPEVLKMIEAGPLTDKRLDWLVIEPPKEFARRIALRAVELERERIMEPEKLNSHPVTQTLSELADIIDQARKP